MWIEQGVGLRFLKAAKEWRAFLLLLFISLFSQSNFLYGIDRTEPQTITYYLYIADFAASFIQIPTSNVSGDSSTIASSYLAGRAPIYNVNQVKAGTCSASFLSMQNEDGIYTDISNYLSADNGLIVTWFTPTTLINLELDSIINSMVTECIVLASTKVGLAPFYGQTFDLIVSSDGEKIYFQFSRTGTIF
jgi:hypothetical protein